MTRTPLSQVAGFQVSRATLGGVAQYTDLTRNFPRPSSATGSDIEPARTDSTSHCLPGVQEEEHPVRPDSTSPSYRSSQSSPDLQAPVSPSPLPEQGHKDYTVRIPPLPEDEEEDEVNYIPPRKQSDQMEEAVEISGRQKEEENDEVLDGSDYDLSKSKRQLLGL